MSSQESDDLKTPKNLKVRQLGLRRSVRRNQVDNQAAACYTTPVPQTKSHHKIRYKSLETPDVSASCSKVTSTLQETPSTPCGTALEKLAQSTNCRPYRLTLSKRIREKLTKKRLEFHMANSNVTQDIACVESKRHRETYQEKNEMPASQAADVMTTSEPQDTMDIRAKLHTMSKQEIIAEIRKLRPDIEGYAVHAKKVQELKEAIETWKNAFRASFHDLYNKINPKLEKAELLQRLRIPLRMLQYLDDDNDDD